MEHQAKKVIAIPYTVEVLDKLRDNSHLGKHKHFAAAGRGRRRHVLFGVPVVLINILLGSVLFVFLGDEGMFPDWGKWGGATLAVIAAGLGAVQTFFNFEKQCSEHRAVANEYLGIARECERLLALYFDGLLQLQALSANIETINDEYAKINTRAEGLTVAPKDYEVALAIQEKKKVKEVSLLQRYKQKIDMGRTSADNDAISPG